TSICEARPPVGSRKVARPPWTAIGLGTPTFQNASAPAGSSDLAGPIHPTERNKRLIVAPIPARRRNRRHEDRRDILLPSDRTRTERRPATVRDLLWKQAFDRREARATLNRLRGRFRPAGRWARLEDFLGGPGTQAGEPDLLIFPVNDQIDRGE